MPLYMYIQKTTRTDLASGTDVGTGLALSEGPGHLPAWTKHDEAGIFNKFCSTIIRVYVLHTTLRSCYHVKIWLLP